MELEIINKLFLELSQVTTAKTEKEIELKSENTKLKEHIKALEIESDDDAKAIKKYIEQKNNLKCCGNCFGYNPSENMCCHNGYKQPHELCRRWTFDNLTKKRKRNMKTYNYEIVYKDHLGRVKLIDKTRFFLQAWISGIVNSMSGFCQSFKINNIKRR